jgi:hypothetical protein
MTAHVSRTAARSRSTATVRDDGTFRADLVQDDIPRLVLMLFGTLPSFAPGSDGWRRYLDLVLDALAAETTELAPPTLVHDHQPVPAAWSVR